VVTGYLKEVIMIGKKERGFVSLALIGALILVVAVGIVGWLIYREQTKEKALIEQTAATSEEAIKHVGQVYAPQTPEGYVKYSNQVLGFSIALPREYGEISEVSDMEGTLTLRSLVLGEMKYGPGINGGFTIIGYTSANQEIVSRKYGPNISLNNGEWIVTQISDSDMQGSKIGDVYKGYDDAVPARQKNGSLTIYSLNGGDEGTTYYRLAFVVKNRLIVVVLPDFSDGLYGASESPNDPTIFNTMVSHVRDSITAI
jgi:hypothetical protein